MKVFTTRDVDFGFPVGSAVVVVAKSRKGAAKLIAAQGGTFPEGVPLAKCLTELDTEKPRSVVLQNGDY